MCNTNYLYIITLTNTMNNIEKRNLTSKVILDKDNRLVEGYALLWEHESRDLGFTEIITKGAITNDVIERSDVFALFNHDKSKVLARSNKGIGNLKLELDETGLKYSFRALNNSLGDDLLEYLNNDMVNESSFAFTVESDDWSNDNGVYSRRINKIDNLFDVSPVWTGAYSNTDVGVAQRSLEAFKANETIPVKEDLTNYFETLKQALK